MNAHTPIATGGVQSVATIATDKASRYLQQLAKHFAHKLPVTFDLRAGKILTLTSPDTDSLRQLESVVERHLVRFAFREELVLDWQPV
jgi:hypothetical protein